MYYNLYLDESETNINNEQRHFCIGGIIVKQNIHDTKLKFELDALKQKLWADLPIPSDIILHEKEVKEGYRRRNKMEQYDRFRNNGKIKMLYAELNKMLVNNDICTIGVSISKDKLEKNYPDPMKHPDIWMIAMQLLLENFTHFLATKNARGQIYYEHISEDHKRKMRRRFYSIKNLGTMYISPDEIQARLMGICFPQKSDNIVGLQLADFIPNDIARKHAGLKAKKNMTLRNSILRKAYCGNISDKSRFGIKMIP